MLRNTATFALCLAVAVRGQDDYTCDGLDKRKCNKKGWCVYSNNNECLAATDHDAWLGNTGPPDHAAWLEDTGPYVLGSDALEDGIMRLANDAVTTGTLAEDAVTSRTLANGAVTSRTLANGAVTVDHLAAGEAVGPGSFAEDAITLLKLGRDLVTSDKIADNAVTGSAIADGTITSLTLSNGAVGTDHIANGAVTTDLIADDSIKNGQDCSAGDGEDFRCNPIGGCSWVPAYEGAPGHLGSCMTTSGTKTGEPQPEPEYTGPSDEETSICNGLKRRKCKKLDGCKYSSKKCIPDTCDGLNKRKCNKKGWCVYSNNNECLAAKADTSGPVSLLCPQDVKECPDGSSVSRDGYNNCQFEPCSENSSPTSDPCATVRCARGLLEECISNKDGETLCISAIYALNNGGV